MGERPLNAIWDAIDDVRRGFGYHEFWRTFAVDEIVSRYRRSRLGQFWITLSVAIFIIVIGGMYRGLLAHSDNDYFAYMAIGYIIWIYINDIVNRSGAIFTSNKQFIMQSALPYSVYSYRLVLTEIYVTAHHLVILVPIFLYLKIFPSLFDFAGAIFGVALIVYSSFWISMILGIMSLRFRDLVPITQSIMRMIFFATPIIWREKQLGGFGGVINAINPVRYYIAVVRGPLLGEEVAPQIYLVTIGLALLLTILGIGLLAATRRKIAYWL
ncbi:MAG: ABC transporter permease [Rhizobiaceae bacterium]|nr:ABC transporter permease [Rhizobiaceae bacterium]